MSQQALYSVYVLAIMVGCIVCVFVGYSLDYIASGGFVDANRVKEMSQEQKQYMRDVRYRNIMKLEQESRRGRR